MESPAPFRPGDQTGKRQHPDAGTSPSDVLPVLRILVADDVQASAMTLVMMLRALGQKADAVFDGPSAVERIGAEEFDVVFLDIAMPGMSGLDVARALRASARFDSLRLIAMTGFSLDEYRQETANAGFNCHMGKPTSMDQLKEVLQSFAARC